MYRLRRVSRPGIFVFCLLVSLLILRATAHASTLQLDWVDNSNNEDGFRIERLLNGVTNQVFTVGQNVTTFTDTNLSAGVTYCYRVRSFNSAGESAPTNQACGQPASSQPPSSGTTPTLTVSPSSAASGATVSASWSGIGLSTARDWLGLYQANAADGSFITWMYVSCSTSPGSARASGNCSFNLPANLAGGNYQIRLFANDGYTRLASANLSVSGGSN